MLKLKPWQLVFLGYLLAVNLVAFGALALFLFKPVFRPSLPPPSIAVVPDDRAIPVEQTLPGATSPSTIPSRTPAQGQPPASSEQRGGEPHHPATPIPALDIPPVPIPTHSSSDSVALNLGPVRRTNQAIAATPVQPTPSNTPSATATNSPQPTATLTASPTRPPTRTPSATPTGTNTPRPTPTSTRTPTYTPRPTRTRTPTASPTSSPTPPPTSTPTPTSQPTVRPTRTPGPTPAPVALAAVGLDDQPVASRETFPVALPVQPDSAVARATALVKAVPLTNGSIALSWAPVDNALQYRIYSDMGTGYGVYVYQARSTQPAFIDNTTRLGLIYRYHVTSLEADREIVLARTRATSFSNQLTGGESLSKETVVPSINVTPIPTALPPDAVLLGLVSDNNFTDNFNTLTIAGEVRNDSSLDVGETNIAITFYDTTGSVIGTTTGKAMLDAISPGETSPFLISMARPAGLASYSLRAVARPVTPEFKAQLTVTEVKRFEDEAGFFHIKGTVENIGNTEAKRTKVVAVIYGRDGEVINVGFTYVSPPSLAPEQQGAYDVIFTYYPGYLTQVVIPFEE